MCGFGCLMRGHANKAVVPYIACQSEREMRLCQSFRVGNITIKKSFLNLNMIDQRSGAQYMVHLRISDSEPIQSHNFPSLSDVGCLNSRPTSGNLLFLTCFHLLLLCIILAVLLNLSCLFQAR